MVLALLMGPASPANLEVPVAVALAAHPTQTQATVSPALPITAVVVVERHRCQLPVMAGLG